MDIYLKVIFVNAYLINVFFINNVIFVSIEMNFDSLWNNWSQQACSHGFSEPDQQACSHGFSPLWFREDQTVFSILQSSFEVLILEAYFYCKTTNLVSIFNSSMLQRRNKHALMLSRRNILAIFWGFSFFVYNMYISLYIMFLVLCF